jgi:hypothetical protein
MSQRCRNKPPAQPLNQAEIDQFHRDGFLGPFTAFTPGEMGDIHKIVRDQVLQTPSPYSAYRTQVRHLDSATVWRMCTAPAIVDRLVSLYGPDLILWYSNFFDKGPERPEHQGEYPWHQDHWHWKLEPLISLSVWLAVTPATIENGCVEVIPGTHKRQIPIVQKNDANLAAWFGGMSADPTHFNEADKVSMVLKPGEFFLFNEGTLHHSNPNRTSERRIGLSFRVTLPSVKSDREYPSLLVSGQDRFGKNPIGNPPTSDPSPEDSARSLPDGRNYTFDLPLYGLGWHVPERQGETWFRWTGPEKNSWLDLRWQGQRAGRLRCRILHAAAPQILQSLQVRINDRPLAMSWSQQEGCVQVEAQVPAAAFEPNQSHARISFHVSDVIRPCDHHASSTDQRQLGLAICGLSLEPLEAAVAEPAVISPPKSSGWHPIRKLFGLGRKASAATYQS